MARTAVIAGTATAVSGGMRERQMQGQQQAAAAQQAADQQAAAEAQQEAETQAQLTAMQAQLAALQQPQDAPTAAPVAGSGGDLMAQLEKLGSLKQAGLLNDEEFAAAKGKLLGL